MRMTMRYKVICYFLAVMMVMGGFPLYVSTVYASGGGGDCEAEHLAYLRAQAAVRAAQAAYDAACAAVVAAQRAFESAVQGQLLAEGALALAMIALADSLTGGPVAILMAEIAVLMAEIALAAAIQGVEDAAEALSRAYDTKLTTYMALTTAKNNAQIAYNAWQACLSGL